MLAITKWQEQWLGRQFTVQDKVQAFFDPSFVYPGLNLSPNWYAGEVTHVNGKGLSMTVTYAAIPGSDSITENVADFWTTPSYDKDTDNDQHWGFTEEPSTNRIRKRKRFF